MVVFKGIEIALVGGEYAIVGDLCVEQRAIRQVVSGVAISCGSALLERVVDH